MSKLNTQETSKKRTKINSEKDESSLSDIVALLPSSLTSFLLPEDALNLLVHCTRTLSQDVCDVVATQGLKTFFDREGVHFGKGCCMRAWHRLVPSKTAAGHLDRCECSRNAVLNDLPLPRLLNARHHLLEAMCLIYKGIRPHCFQVLQLDRSFERRQYGVLQPVVFSLTAALEKQQKKSGQPLEPINTKDVATLTHLLDSLETDFGTRFFRSTDRHRSPAGMVEAHWKNIHVDLATDTMFCHFCDVNTVSMVEGLLNPQFREAEYEFLMRQHCRDVYQPLKKFMTRHLQHVRYVHPPSGWNEAGDNFHGNEWLDLIAGFTSGGVLCGVYLTDVRIPHAWINDRLAPGAYPFDESAIDLTRLRIAYYG